MVDQLPPDNELPPAGYWYTPAFFLGQKGFVLHALGDVPGARQAARDRLATMRQSSPHRNGRGAAENWQRVHNSNADLGRQLQIDRSKVTTAAPALTAVKNHIDALYAPCRAAVSDIPRLPPTWRPGCG